MRIVWIALVTLAVWMPETAMAAWYIYCRNDRIVIDQRDLASGARSRDGKVGRDGGLTAAPFAIDDENATSVLLRHDPDVNPQRTARHYTPAF